MGRKQPNPIPPEVMIRPLPPPEPPRRFKSRDRLSFNTIDSSEFYLEIYQAIAHGIAGTNAGISDIDLAVKNCIRIIKEGI